MNRTGIVLLAVCLTILAQVGKAGGRSSGETISDPIFIPAIPYMDTGTTCEYFDDYDEACPYAGSTAPDVVYSYVPTSDETVDIDLCGSSYDTKVFVYENQWTPGNPYACNDDFYPGHPCGIYVSKIEELSLSAGNTYYIVVDGYNVACGDYVLQVSHTTEPPVVTVEVTFSPSDVIVSTLTGIDEETYTVLKLPESSVLAEFDSTGMLGEPMLPKATVYVAMPSFVGADEVAVSTFTRESIPIDYPIWPAQPLRSPCMGEPGDDWCSPDPAVYEVDVPYPGQLVEFVGMTDMAGQGMVVLDVYPIEFNPVQQECYLYTSIVLEIPAGDPYVPDDYLPTRTSELGRRSYEKMLCERVINPDDVQTLENPNPPEPFLPDLGEIDHVIIGPAAVMPEWSRLVKHRTMFGMRSRYFSIERIYNYYPGLEEIERIRGFIRDAHEESGITHFLLAGSPHLIPIKIGWDPGEPDIESDRYYADYDRDWHDEVYVGRVTANTSSQVENFVDKLIRYETGHTPTKDALLIGMDLSDWTRAEELMEVIDSEDLQPRNWNVEKVYDSHPDEPSHKDDVISAIVSGTHLIVHGDHANEEALGTGWERHRSLLESTELTELDPPEGRYMIFASLGCWTNDMFGQSIARDLVVHSDRLAVAFAGNTYKGKGTPGNPLSHGGGMLKRFTANAVRKQSIGCALSGARRLAYYSSSEWNFNLLGDPAMPVVQRSSGNVLVLGHPDLAVPWEEQPFPIHIEDENGAGIDGAYVCLWEPVVGDSSNIYLTGFTDAAGDITFTLPASDAGMYVTVSHPDYPPYMAEIGAPATDVDEDSASEELLQSPRLALHPAAPSPFSGGTTVRFDLPAAGRVQLDVFDVTGRRLRSLLGEERLEAGRHSVVWDGRTSSGEHVGSGMYWLRLSTAEERRSRRVIVIR